MGQVKQIKGLLGDFIEHLKEHDSGETPGINDLRQAPQEVRQKVYESFVDMMDAIYETIHGQQEKE
ncbi:hypothetical protein VF14_25450 [Nostoc linckia z18]|uniref:Uncharacterized protein n=2 Tax=Nostoc linckia TaxID=92942 RepID=A0A9Q5Z914_NOSLI|nr:hypothetical protein [Nostoc linckia]PHK27886.1 hypothetical protein VF12_33965 [Nostoc linckia z15]PHK44328.1 hypothetical protein VF13_22630 [Nostoc linckia z16]PHJ56428.1 hypothetical protein VF03_37590 [Nostoc linckia z2]PHJ58660.1 hypothetical protein VF05_33490 [Nostoc linckia z3]PHJ62808.1 hypothetical protein VF02_16810 [Nostoc linckia z1]